MECIKVREKTLKPIIAIFVYFLLLNTCVASNELMEDCGNPFNNAVGPFDYTNYRERTEELPIVERHHFTRDVENLIKGATSEFIMHDLDYTLRACPNHHRALYAVSKYQLRKNWRKGRYRTAECYFERAKIFKPQDGIPYLLYAIFLHKKEKYNEALQEYMLAKKLLPDSPEVSYNLGLLFVDMEDHKQALKYAKRAYELGHPLPGLKNKLKKLGEWREGK
jgi:tetratricopeptide (TPR) repeat protein